MCDVSKMTSQELDRIAGSEDFDFGRLTDAQLERIVNGEHPSRVLSEEQLADCGHVMP